MFTTIVTRPNQVITISTVANNVNLRARSNTPTYPVNLFCFIDANVSSNVFNGPALRLGTGWGNSTYFFIRNSANIVGNVGNTGVAGTGGAGGGGGGYPTNPGSAGSAGGTGVRGANGSIAFQAETGNQVLRMYLNNLGIIRGGNGGPGGPGGGGGGGGGGLGYLYVPSKGVPYYNYYGGGGGGGGAGVSAGTGGVGGGSLYVCSKQGCAIL